MRIELHDEFIENMAYYYHSTKLNQRMSFERFVELTKERIIYNCSKKISRAR